jgi:hypothetical protein
MNLEKVSHLALKQYRSDGGSVDCQRWYAKR